MTTGRRCPDCDRLVDPGNHRATCPRKDPMPIARDLSDLPTPGMAPDPHPRFVGALVDQWAETHDDDKPTAHGTPFRHSDAGKCARAISYTAAGIPRSDPMDLTGVWNTSLGSLIHNLWQQALQRRWPGAEVEVTCATVGADGSGHVDAVVVDEGRTVAVELKTIGGFGFKAAVGAARKGTPAEGPRQAHLAQAALNGRAVDADEIVVAYLAKECISDGVAHRFALGANLARFAAEWTLTRDQYEPLADAEAARAAGILALVADGQLAARKSPEMPPRAEVTDPTTGAWEVRHHDGDEVTVTDVGTTWECGYCPYQTLCALTGPGCIRVVDAETATADLMAVA